MNKNVHIISAPFVYGSHRKGSDLGPKAIYHAELLSKMKNNHISFTETFLSEVKGESPVKENNLRHLSSVISFSNELSNAVSQSVTNYSFPLVLGGDHAIAIGTLSGLLEHYSNLGVIWFDAHPDLNTNLTTPSGNIHGMSLAVSLGIGDSRLTSLFPHFIKPENVVLLGSRDIDAGELELIKDLNITHYDMNKVHDLGIHQIMNEIQQKFALNRVDGVHLSFDLDSLDETFAPGVGTPVENGFSLQEATNALEQLNVQSYITSAEFVETNPLYDLKNTTAEVTVELIMRLLNKPDTHK